MIHVIVDDENEVVTILPDENLDDVTTESSQDDSVNSDGESDPDGETLGDESVDTESDGK